MWKASTPHAKGFGFRHMGSACTSPLETQPLRHSTRAPSTAIRRAANSQSEHHTDYAQVDRGPGKAHLQDNIEYLYTSLKSMYRYASRDRELSRVCKAVR